jgi:hypothetical protein
MFRSWIQNLRLPFAPELKDKTLLLFLDNHTSCECVEARVLLKETIEVVTFPPSVTHILQLFNVCLARPFKIEVRKIFCGGSWQRDEHGYVGPSRTERLRRSRHGSIGWIRPKLFSKHVDWFLFLMHL